MKKINKNKLSKIKTKLDPFWKKREKIYSEFLEKQKKIEDELNKELNLNIKLEFFYCDGECVGIGAENYLDRKYFPLIQDSDFQYLK